MKTKLDRLRELLEEAEDERMTIEVGISGLKTQIMIEELKKEAHPEK